MANNYWLQQADHRDSQESTKATHQHTIKCADKRPVAITTFRFFPQKPVALLRGLLASPFLFAVDSLKIFLMAAVLSSFCSSVRATGIRMLRFVEAFEPPPHPRTPPLPLQGKEHWPSVFFSRCYSFPIITKQNAVPSSCCHVHIAMVCLMNWW